MVEAPEAFLTRILRDWSNLLGLDQSAPAKIGPIAVRPPEMSCYDLVDIVLNARQKSGRRAVITALDLPAQRTANIRLAAALISPSAASGSDCVVHFSFVVV